MKTDLQKFKDFFDEMNIKCHIDKDGEYLWIDESHLAPNYGASLEIVFNDEGKFFQFETWGE